MYRATKSYAFRRFMIALAAAFLILASFLVLAITGILHSSADRLENGAELAEGSLLTYRITVRGNGSNNQIKVTDTLPLGLEFVEVKAVASESCGTLSKPRYSEYLRRVSFRVDNLGPDCAQSVDVVTRAPELGQNIRRDFYNIVNATDGVTDVVSEPVNAFLGQADAPLFKVKYEYQGAVPAGAPAAPVELAYAEGDAVLVNPTPKMKDYGFDGWYTADTTIVDGVFVIGNAPVTFSGSFTDDKKPVIGALGSTEQGGPLKYLILVVIAVVLIAAIMAGAWLAGRHGLSKGYYVSVAAVLAIAVLSFGAQFFISPRVTAAPVDTAPFSLEVTMEVE